MSEKSYSISRAIRDVLQRGTPTGREAEFHFEEMRTREANKGSHSWLPQVGAGPGAEIIHAPFGRDLVAQPYPPGVPGGVASTGGGNLVGHALQRSSPLLTWSSAISAGATVLTGLRENLSIAALTALPEPEWIPEVGFSPITDPEFSQVFLGGPKRVSGTIRVSRQLLIGGGPDTDTFLINDLARSCSSMLDRMIFYGESTANPDQPNGIINTQGIWRLDIGTNTASWDIFTQAEGLIELQDIGLANFGFVTNPTVKKALRDRPLWTSGSARSQWEALPNAHSSNGIQGNHIFFGAWPMCVVGIWSDSATITVNPYTQALSGQVDITADLFCNFCLRNPRFFGVIDIDAGSIVPPGQPRTQNTKRLEGPTLAPPEPTAASPTESELRTTNGPKGRR